MTTIYDHRKIREAFTRSQVLDLAQAAGGFAAMLDAVDKAYPNADAREQADRLRQLEAVLTHANASR